MAESIIFVLNYAAYASVAVAFVALPFMLFGVARAVYKRPWGPTRGLTFSDMPIRAMSFFAVSIAVFMLITAGICGYAHNQALQFLESLPSKHTILVEGQPPADEQNLIATLKSTHWRFSGHHSHPTTTIHIAIEAEGRVLYLNLRRDSGDPQEYWVFYPKYRLSSANEIGRISTALLDGY